VEPKEDMKKRGVTSPDRADALFGCLESGVRDVAGKVDNWRGGGVVGMMTEQLQLEEMAGAWAGD